MVKNSLRAWRKNISNFVCHFFWRLKEGRNNQHVINHDTFGLFLYVPRLVLSKWFEFSLHVSSLPLSLSLFIHRLNKSPFFHCWFFRYWMWFFLQHTELANWIFNHFATLKSHVESAQIDGKFMCNCGKFNSMYMTNSFLHTLVTVFFFSVLNFQHDACFNPTISYGYNCHL